MSITSDFRFIMNAMKHAYNSRPSSRVNQPSRIAAQHGYKRGFEYGISKAKQYYPGASSGVFENDWVTSVQSLTSIIRSDIQKLWARSEKAVREEPVARRAQSILNSFIVGQGNRPYPAITKYNGEPVETLNSKLSQDWDRFNDEGMRTTTEPITMYEAQGVHFNTIFTYGSALTQTVSSKGGSYLKRSFQIIKPTHLDFSKDTFFNDSNNITDGNMIVHGIKFTNGYPDPTQFFLNGISNPISSDRMFLSFKATEAEQYLGIPWLTPAILHLWDNQQLFADKLKQSRVAAKLGVYLEKEDQAGIQSLLDSDDNGNSYLDLDFQGMYYGKGEPKPISITDPISDTFEALVKMTLFYVSMGLDISYGTLTSDLNNSNFSASRQNRIIENKVYRVLWKWFTKSVCQRQWERFVQWEVEEGKLQQYGLGLAEYLKDPWYYNQCYWLPMDSTEWIDPKADQEALLLAYKMGQITYEKLCSIVGTNKNSMIEKIKRERDELVAAGLDHLLPENIDKQESQQGNSDSNSDDSGVTQKEEPKKDGGKNNALV